MMAGKKVTNELLLCCATSHTSLPVWWNYCQQWFNYLKHTRIKETLIPPAEGAKVPFLVSFLVSPKILYYNLCIHNIQKIIISMQLRDWIGAFSKIRISSSCYFAHRCCRCIDRLSFGVLSTHLNNTFAFLAAALRVFLLVMSLSVASWKLFNLIAPQFATKTTFTTKWCNGWRK